MEKNILYNEGTEFAKLSEKDIKSKEYKEAKKALLKNIAEAVKMIEKDNFNGAIFLSQIVKDFGSTKGFQVCIGSIEGVRGILSAIIAKHPDIFVSAVVNMKMPEQQEDVGVG
jgi:hypothetical protein